MNIPLGQPNWSHSVMYCLLVEDLDAMIRAVAYQDAAPPVYYDRVRHIELAGAGSLAAPFHQIASMLIKLHDAIVPVAVGHEDVAVGGDRESAGSKVLGPVHKALDES